MNEEIEEEFKVDEVAEEPGSTQDLQEILEGLEESKERRSSNQWEGDR
jgi:hypothetical protein